MRMRSGLGMVLLATAALGTSGCCGCCGGGGGKSCKAQVEYTAGNYSAAKPFVGEGGGKTESDARINACWDYCFEADPAFDGIYRVWLDSPDGRSYKAQADKLHKTLSKRRIIIDDQTSLETPFKACVDRCGADAAAGRSGLRFKPATCT